MGSAAALHSLAGLIATIRSPLVDELLAKEGISKILAFLTSPDLEVRLLALDCVVAVGYVGSKDAVDAMMRAGVVKRLLEMQRTEVAVDDDRRQMSRTDLSERSALASAVGRFAVGVEVGEGLRQREKRAFKLEVLRRVREAAADEAEVATVISEILWGSTSW
ncbi:hypothetical protein HPP92_027271 [Vanilla planifolia]|nr:hypothetical protein HPP92_027271 [Vanilla planifolia]